MNAALGLLTKAEAAQRRLIYNNPTYNEFVGYADIIREKQMPFSTETFITLNAVMPDAAVNYIINTLGYAVTATPEQPGFQTVTKIDWAV